VVRALGPVAFARLLALAASALAAPPPAAPGPSVAVVGTIFSDTLPDSSVLALDWLAGASSRSGPAVAHTGASALTRSSLTQVTGAATCCSSHCRTRVSAAR